MNNQLFDNLYMVYMVYNKKLILGSVIVVGVGVPVVVKEEVNEEVII